MPLSRIVSRLHSTSREIVVRLVAIVVMLSLSLPMVMFAEWGKTSARTITEKPRPASAPPEPYLLPSGKVGWESLGERIKAFGNDIEDLFQTRNLQSEPGNQTASSDVTTNQDPQKSDNSSEAIRTNEEEETAASEKQLSEKVREELPVKTTQRDQTPTEEPESQETESQETSFPPQPSGTVDFDFDGDGKADIGRWHPSTREFKVKNSGNASTTIVTFSSASATAKPAPADYDGNGNTDIALFDAGTWFIRTTPQTGPSSFDFSGNTSYDKTISSFGQAGDIPMSGDYRNDSPSPGKTDQDAGQAFEDCVYSNYP